MITNTFVLDPRFPDCTLTTYIHSSSSELAASPRRAIIVCPGGAYYGLSDREAEPIALRFASEGFNAFVIRYSIKEKAVNDAPLIEGALAVKHVREHAAEYSIDPDKIFVIGFSAGGHFAGMCGTLWNDPVVRDALGIDRGEAPEGINKPTATILSYPVITGGPYAHRGSIDMLVGGPSEGTEGALRYSLELSVNADTCPAFIWHTYNDPCVPVQNSLLYANAMAAAGVPFELHIYPDGPHGLSLCNEQTYAGYPGLIRPDVAGWIDEAVRYIKSFGA